MPDERAELRDRLVGSAGALLDAGGPQALQARKVAADAGTSTQAIYTHFGGMPGLLQAIVAESLVDFAAHVRQVEVTDDPVADHLTCGWAYASWALAHEHRYRLIFGEGGDVRPDGRIDLSPGGPVADFPEGQDAFSVLVGSVARMLESGRIRPADPLVVAGQFLAVTHGYVLLELAHVFGGAHDGEDGGGTTVIGPRAVNLLVGLGDRRRSAERSWRAALVRVATA